MKTAATSLSAIVPVYNALPYLRDCLSGLDGCEVICVDDGSTDGSGRFLDDFAQRRTGVTVVHQANGGPSVARNAALERAQGEYVTFLDADDALEDGFAEALRGIVDAFGAVDVVQFGFAGFGTPAGPTHELDEGERRRYLDDVCRVDRFGLVTGKVYRRDVLNGLRFDPDVVGEDTLFAVQVLKRARRVVMSDRNLYRYRVVEGSYSHRPFPGLVPKAERMLERLREEIGPSPAYYEHALGKFRWCVASSGLSVSELKARPLFREALRKMFLRRAWRRLRGVFA